MTSDIPHSSLGKASFWTGVAAFIVFLIAVGFGLSSVYTKHGGGAMSLEGIVLNMTFLAVFVANLVGIGLGIAGLCEKSAKKVFAVLGIFLNLSPTGIFGGSMALQLIFG